MVEKTIANADKAATTKKKKRNAAVKGSTPLKGKGLNLGIWACGALTAAGLALWCVELFGGMSQTSMRNLDSWGLYITMFMFFVGLSTGSLLVGSAPKAFGTKGLHGLSKTATLLAIACAVGAIGFVTVDLGQPMRLWELFAFSNLGSPLMWDIVVLGVYLVFTCVYLWAQYAYEADRISQKTLRAMSVVALVCSVLVLSVDAWIFSLQQGRQMWHTALLGPWFISSALVCGTALLVCVALALSKTDRLSLEQEDVVRLARLLGTFVCVDLYFFGCDLITEGYPQGEGVEMVRMLVVGPLAPFFWTEVLGCGVAAVVCFTPRLRTTPLLAMASVLAIVGIFCKRVQLLVGGFQLPTMSMAGVTTSATITDWQAGLHAYDGIVYWPSPIEFGVTAGVVALVALVFLVSAKRLSLNHDSEQS